MAEFTIQTVRAGAIPGVSWVPHDSRQDLFILRSPTGSNYLVVNLVAIQVFKMLDGKNDIPAIQQRIAAMYGVEIRREPLATLLAKFIRNGLAQIPPEGALFADLTQQNSKSFGAYSSTVDISWVVEFLYRQRCILFNPATKLLLCALAAYGVYCGISGGNGADPAALVRAVDVSKPNYFLFLILPALIVITAVHELSHAYMLRYFDVPTKGIGVGLMWGVMPTVYTDTSNLYHVKDKVHRALVSAAGPMADLVCFAVLNLIVAFVAVDSVVHRFTLALAGTMMVVLVVNLNPFFLRTDGYWILSDFWGELNLRRSSIKNLKLASLSLIRWRRPLRVGEVRWGLAVYGAISIVATSLLVAWFGLKMLHAVVGQLVVLQSLGLL